MTNIIPPRLSATALTAVFLAGFIAPPAVAQLRPLSTDRPDTTESPRTVDAGHFQFELELAAWERDGVVTVLPAFSARPEGDVSFVQHRVWSERARIAKLFQEGATVFVCGDGKQMAPAVRDTLIKTYREASGASEDEAHVWADVIEREQGRYVSDVFS